jgi:hypothetical protein
MSAPPVSRSPADRDAGEVALLADRIAAAAAGCPAVATLADGPVATYLSGRTVTGVAVRGTAVEIAMIARFGLPLAEVADQVRAAVQPLAPGLRVDVRIDDIALPEIGPDQEI